MSPVRLSKTTRAGLARLPAELAAAGFHAPQVAARLGGLAQAPLLYFPRFGLLQFLVPRRDDPLPDALTAFFLAQAALPWATLARTCSTAALDALQEVGWVHRKGREAFCDIALVPYANLYFACDIPSARSDQVFQPDDSTATLLAYLDLGLGPRRERALDLGTGSGILALYLARHLRFGHVRALDVNPRAVRFATLNAALNDVPLEVVQADVGEGARAWGRELDLVTFTLPWIHSSGPRVRPGPSHQAAGGEKLLWAVLRTLRTSMAREGRALLFHQALLPFAERFAPQLVRMLERTKLRAAHLTIAELSVRTEFGLTRVEHERAGWPRLQHVRHLEPPSPLLDVESLERRFSSQDLLETPVRETCRVRAAPTLEALPGASAMPPPLRALLQRCDGNATVAELRAGHAGTDFDSALRWLVREGAVHLETA